MRVRTRFLFRLVQLKVTLSIPESLIIEVKPPVPSSLELTELILSRNRPIRTRYLGHVTGYLYQPIRDQYFLIRSVPEIIRSSSSPDPRTKWKALYVSDWCRDVDQDESYKTKQIIIELTLSLAHLNNTRDVCAAVKEGYNLISRQHRF
eukprot:sb/3473626/